MGRSWERRKRGAWKFGLGTFSGPPDIHPILPLNERLGHSSGGTHKMEFWCWKYMSACFVSQEAAEKRGCFLPLPKCGSLFLLFFFPRSSLPFKVTGSYPGEREDLSPSPEMWTLQHLHSGENCSLSEVLSPKTEVVIRRSLASKTADIIYIQ